MTKSEIIRSFILLGFLIFLPCCHPGYKKQEATVPPGKNELADLNRYMVQKDKEIIESYIERKKLGMKESPTGLWYLIKSEGTGDLLKENDRVYMNYECGLLDGTKCYSSDSLGVKEIVLGKSSLEKGLDEGLRMLRSGGEASFILPPFLAFGLLGDGKKIPPRAIIIYNITVSKKK